MSHTDHILVVDDDLDIRQMVSDYLRKNGLRTTLAANGRELRAALETGDVDLIVLDIMMPGENGLISLQKPARRQVPPCPDGDVDGTDDETDRIVGLEMGADDYVVKPTSLARAAGEDHLV